jgi:HSP20 family molecular chaperone IbpA
MARVKLCKENLEVRHPVSGEGKNRRERRPFDIFEEFKEIEKIMNEIMQQAYKKNKHIRPRVYVFSFRADPSLRAKSRRCANVDRRRYNSRVREQREALVDVFDKKDEVLVVTELPNVKREDIELHRAGDFLTVSVNKPQLKNVKTIKLPTQVNIKEAEINYKNGVLEVTLPKTEKEL